MPRGRIIARKTNTWLLRLCQGRKPTTGKRLYLNYDSSGRTCHGRGRTCALVSQIQPRSEASSIRMNTDCRLHAAVDGQLRAKTARDYPTQLARYLRPDPGQVKFSRQTARPPTPADPYQVGAWARTVRYTHAVLRSALDQGRRSTLLVEDPAADMPLHRTDKRKFCVLKPGGALHSFCWRDRIRQTQS